MIVYNVKRKWFAEKLPAETYRISERLKPASLTRLVIEDRYELAALLNALCEPPLPAQGQPLPEGISQQVVDHAFVPVSRDIPECVPDFLLNDEQRKWRKENQ